MTIKKGWWNEKYLFILSGSLLGTLITIVVMWKYAEKIVFTKQGIKQKNRERGTPLIGFYKKLGKVFIPPIEAVRIPESKTIYQYPNKSELEDQPGIKSDKTYDELFYKYIVEGKMTKAEAFRQAITDFPTIYSLYNRESFTQAMRRRERKQSMTT